MRSERALACLAVTVVGLSFGAVACGDDSSDDTSGEATTATAPEQSSDEELLTEFLDLLLTNDVDGLDDYLSPAFQIVRTDGNHLTKDEYLLDLPTLHDFEVVEVEGTRSGDTRVVRSVLRVDAVVDGTPLTGEPSPYLSTFAWNGERWQLAGHANLTPIET